METKHTKGEWYLVSNFPTEEKHDFQIACNCKKGSRQIAQILKRNYSLYTDLPTLEESEANAKLIAAAPELLEEYIKDFELLKSMIKLCDNNQNVKLMLEDMYLAKEELIKKITE